MWSKATRRVDRKLACIGVESGPSPVKRRFPPRLAETLVRCSLPNQTWIAASITPARCKKLVSSRAIPTGVLANRVPISACSREPQESASSSSADDLLDADYTCGQGRRINVGVAPRSRHDRNHVEDAACKFHVSVDLDLGKSGQGNLSIDPLCKQFPGGVLAD